MQHKDVYKRQVLGQGNEPKFVITDLLPHLGAEQGKKPLSEAIPGENLNILMGSRPLGEDGDSDRVKLRVLDLLHEKYGICEDDFTSAELEVVPAFNATDLGLDRSLIGAYGHDDRVCSYACLLYTSGAGTWSLCMKTPRSWAASRKPAPPSRVRGPGPA